MNIVLREIKASFRSLIIWSISMVFLIFVGMVKYSSFEAVGQSANDFLDQLPPALLNIMGMSGVDLTSILGFYSIFFLYFMLLAGIHAIMLGAVIISKEERDKTADFLFVKPIHRSRIITAKLTAILIDVLVLNLITLISSVVFVGIYNKGDSINNQIIKLMIALFILQVLFASIGAGISAVVKDTKKATSMASTILLLTFILSVAIDLYDKISFLKYFTPFKYFIAVDLVNGSSFNILHIFLSLIIIIISVSTTYILYRKRDLYI